MIVTQQASKKLFVKDTLLANPDEFHNSTWTHYFDAWNRRHMAIAWHNFAKILENLEKLFAVLHQVPIDGSYDSSLCILPNN